MERTKVATAVVEKISDPTFANDYIQYYNGDKSISLKFKDRNIDWVCIVTVERDPYIVAELNFADTPNVKRHIFPTMYMVIKNGEDVTIKEYVVSDSDIISVPANDVSDELRDDIINSAKSAVKAIQHGKNPNNVFIFR